MSDGEEVLQAIEDKIGDLVSRGIKPKIVHLGNYCYYLLKDHFIRTGVKKDNPYYEIYKISLAGHELILNIDRETNQGGLIKQSHYEVNVYGN